MRIPHLTLPALVLCALPVLPAPPVAAQGGPVHRFRLLEGPPDTPPRECPAAGTVRQLPATPPKLRSAPGSTAGDPAPGSTEALAQAARLVQPELAADRELALELGVEKDVVALDHCAGKPGVRVTLTALTHEVATYRVRFVSPGGEVQTEAEARVAVGEQVAVAGPGTPERCRILVVELVQGAKLNPVEPPGQPSLKDPPG